MARKKKEVIRESKEETKQPNLTAIAEKIVELSNVKNFIEVIVIDSPKYTYEYIDFVDEEKQVLKGLEQPVEVGESCKHMYRKFQYKDKPKDLLI